ncbi:NADH-quinone oxidoreductase subunit I [Arcicella rosea]|uniref:4Fe-4S binding protein n=1 Tax=Arcicella rosea TaxID=502909 RepID=UPI00345D7D4A
MSKGANNTYFGNIKEGIKSSLKGLSLSWRHLKEARQSRKPIFVNNPDYFKQETGIVTLQYPHEKLPIPDNGRYQLHNEMDDCIVCDKCAKICPVDCIEIEPIKATGIAGYASDGSAIRLYAAKFDIDMAKCCFCGLCTTVCPTECLTMTQEYDFSVFDITKHNFAFGNLSPEQAQEKRDLYDQFMLEKEAMKGLKTKKTEDSKTQDTRLEDTGQEEKKLVAKPAFKPAFKKKESGLEDEGLKEKGLVDSGLVDEGLKEKNTQLIPHSSLLTEVKAEEITNTPKPKPVFKPSFKKKESGLEDEGLEDSEHGVKELKENNSLLKAHSSLLTEVKDSEEVKTEEITLTPKPKPVFKPSFKKKEEGTESSEVKGSDEVKAQEITNAPKPKPVFKPSFKKKEEGVESSEVKGSDEVKAEEITNTPKPKPVFKPSFKKKDSGIEDEGLKEKSSQLIAQSSELSENSGLNDTDEVKAEEVTIAPKPKPVFKPSFKPKPKTDN